MICIYSLVKVSSRWSGQRQDELFRDFCLACALCPDAAVAALELFEESRRICVVVGVDDDLCLCRALGEHKVAPGENGDPLDAGRGETAEEDVVADGAGCA